MRTTPEQWKSWEEDGVLAVADAVGGDELERLRAAFDSRAAEAKADWLTGVAAGTHPAAFFDIPNAMEKGDIFVDLADHPSYYGLLVDFSKGQVCLQFPQFRTVVPSPLSYVGWHYDVSFSNPLHMKIQLYLDDVGEDGGPFAYVPGSHRPENHPLPQVRHQEDMPGHRTFPGSAGTAILFNSWACTHRWSTSPSRRGNRSSSSTKYSRKRNSIPSAMASWLIGSRQLRSDVSSDSNAPGQSQIDSGCRD